jgi:hypothetical protein
MRQEMSQMRQVSVRSVRSTAAAGVLGVVALFCLGLFLVVAAPARASWEGVGCFAGSLPGPKEGCQPVEEEMFGEEVQLGGVGGLAVNRTGAGGVPAGTVYAATLINTQNVRVAMYEPVEAGGVTGGLKFEESWEVPWVEESYERCGPLLGTEVKEGKEVAQFPCKPQVKSGSVAVDVEVDQANGNVYVLQDAGNLPAGTPVVVEYSAKGAEVITRFGEKAAEGKTVAETPAEIHRTPEPGGLAINAVGDVYVYDETQIPSFYHRLMVFAPHEGKVEDYEYAGEVEASAAAVANLPLHPVSDAAGNVYVAGESFVDEYAPGVPASYPAAAATPICHFSFAKGGITAITVNPETGEVFFFDYKLPKRVYELSACEGGEFHERGAFEVKPERADLSALAFDPGRRFAAGRGLGILYGAAPSPVPEGGGGEPNQSSLGYIFAQVEEDPPVVQSESVAKVGSGSARLQASIDPAGHQTHYAFQYMSEAAYEEAGESFAGAQEAPHGGGVLVNAQGVQSVAVTLAGLVPGGEYRYRVVAESECAQEKACPVQGAALRFRAFPEEAAGLPDGRVWELVSPVQKHGGQVFPADPRVSSCGAVECKPGVTYVHFPMQSAPGGDAVAYEGSAFGPGEGATVENEYVARRTGSGWRSVNLSPSLLLSGAIQGYKALDPALTRAVLDQFGPALAPGAPGEYEDFYSQPVAEPFALRSLLGEEAGLGLHRPATGMRFEVRYAGASADLSRVFFEANDALTEKTAVAPAAVDGGPGKFNLYEWQPASGELVLVNVFPDGSTEPGAVFGPGSALTVSADGSRAFWSAASGQLYVRIDGTGTRKIEDPGKFLSASADGSRVLLTDGCLYDVEKEACEDLTQGEGGFQGVVGQSEDLSHIYFVDTAVLPGTAEACRKEMGVETCEEAQAGKDNLYAWQEGTVRFIAIASTEDNVDWAPAPSDRTAEASPDGGFLAFLSHAPLTGYDNVGPCFRNSSGEIFTSSCPEVYLYDAGTGELHCASCDPSGAPPLGWSVLRRIDGPSYLPQPHYLTDAGRLYFDSQDSLTPFDTNEGIEDVYEWEPGGVGSCSHEQGCVYLISGGHGAVDSNLLAVDETGKNVFFTTRDRLVRGDKDELIDLYDAREGGAPEVEPPGRSECEREPGACPVSGAPSPEIPPTSSTLTGPGSLSLPVLPVNAAKPRAKVLTRAEELARALRACGKESPKSKRTSCEKRARTHYAPKQKRKPKQTPKKKGDR